MLLMPEFGKPNSRTSVRLAPLPSGSPYHSPNIFSVSFFTQGAGAGEHKAAILAGDIDNPMGIGFDLFGRAALE